MDFDGLYFAVLGTGRLALQCGEYLKDNWKAEVVLYDVNREPSKSLRQLCENSGLEYKFRLKEQLFTELAAVEKHMLLISAYNPYIIPAGVIEKENVRAINVHHALLPAHPGRNAEAWAIFEMDEFAGITWHILSAKVDKGEIIVQKKLKLDDKITSLKLLNEQNKLAIEAFREFIGDFVQGKCELVKQAVKEGEQHAFHYSKDRPNGGVLDLAWDTKKISAFLRAYDYGFYNILGKPRLFYEGQQMEWTGYRINPCMGEDKRIWTEGTSLVIAEGGMEIRLLKIKRL